MGVEDEKPILLRELARVLPGKPKYATVHKWCRYGLVRNRGTTEAIRVKMEAIRLTSGMASSIEAYNRFIRRLNGFEA